MVTLMKLVSCSVANCCGHVFVCVFSDIPLTLMEAGLFVIWTDRASSYVNCCVTGCDS